MKFTVIRSRFLDLLSNVQSVVPSRPALQIISNALIEAKEDGTLTLTATDLDVTVRTTLAADVKVDEPGQTTLPVRRIVELLRMAPEGEIQFDVDGDDVARVVTPAAKYRLIGLDAREFPVIREPAEEAKCFTLDRAIFREMLRKTAYAAGTDETRRILTGVLLQFADGKLTMVATDGKRLALVEQELEFPPESACEMIVARAAPRTSILKPKMKIGSRITLINIPATIMPLAIFVEPAAIRMSLQLIVSAAVQTPQYQITM